MCSQAQQIDNPDLRVARMAAEDWGVLTSQELYACGLGPGEVRTRLRRGHLHRLYRGVYAVGHTNLTLEGRFLAAVKACGPGAVLSHLSAAILLGLTDPFDRVIDVTIEGTSTRTHPGIRVHRTRSLDARTTTTRHRGVPTTTPLRTLHDCARDTTPAGLARLVRRAQALHHVNVRQLATSPRLAPIVATGAAPTRSEFEDILLDLVLTTFEPPDVNPKLLVAGRTIYPDLRWPAQRLCVEADSRTWHAGELAQAQDAERQALLEAYGERVLRVTWRQTVARPRQTIARLAAAGAPTLNRP